MDDAILGPAPGDSSTCERVLRSIPDWFGIEEALMQYVRDVADLPTFTARRNGAAGAAQDVGLLAVRRHFPESAEIHVMGVLAGWHRRGVGREMTLAAERWLRDEGVRFLQVKTLSPAREDAAYAATRRFYTAMGFVPLEEFPLLWGPRNPCLQLIKAL